MNITKLTDDNDYSSFEPSTSSSSCSKVSYREKKKNNAISATQISNFLTLYNNYLNKKNSNTSSAIIDLRTFIDKEFRNSSHLYCDMFLNHRVIGLNAINDSLYAEVFQEMNTSSLAVEYPTVDDAYIILKHHIVKLYIDRDCTKCKLGTSIECHKVTEYKNNVLTYDSFKIDTDGKYYYKIIKIYISKLHIIIISIMNTTNRT